MDLPDWLPTPGNRRYQRGINQLENIVDTLFEERGEDASGDDLLSLLLTATANGEGPSERGIRSQLMTFLFAGHETSATASTWALYELDRKPAVVRRLTTEVDEVVDGPYATLADLPELEYTEQVLRETLRRYPPAAAIFRETDEAVHIGDYRLPEDTYVILSRSTLLVEFVGDHFQRIRT